MRLWSSLLLILLLAGCGEPTYNEPQKTLPKLGPLEVLRDTVDGEVTILDTLWYTIPPFEFVNQDSQVVNNATFDNKVYVADFFFTSCPSICPKMKEQMLRIYERFGDNDTVMLLSHSIDPKHDTVEVLHAYAEKLGVSSDKWHLVTGDKAHIYEMAEKYFIAAEEDPSVPGGFAHSGGFLLVDMDGHIRGHYDGTKPQQVDNLMDDMQMLLDGYR